MYDPQPRFAHAVNRDGTVDVFIEHVEFVLGGGEPIERVWATSYVGKAKDKAQATKLSNIEAKKRGYTK